MTIRAKLADFTTISLSRLIRLPGPTFAKHVALGLANRYSLSGEHRIELLSPQPKIADSTDRDLVDRIYQAFERAKQDYVTSSPAFRPSSLWDNFIAEAFEDFDLSTLNGFEQFLTNFGCCKNYTGFEYGHLIHRCLRDPSMDTLLRHFAVPRMIAYWRKENGFVQSLSKLQYPMHGNMTGVTIDDLPIPLNAFFDDQCSRMITDCIYENGGTVAELGGGYGGLAYCLLNNPKVASFVGYDLPEVLACCSYYLMKSFPDRQFCLYGEDSNPIANLGRYDAVLLPGFCLNKMDEDTFDVFVNRSSLSEMKPETAATFLDQIWTSSKYFWHLNHESRRNRFESGELSLLNKDYLVVRPGRLY